MINLVLLSASQDATCAETLRTDLETQGYRVWREPQQGLQVNNIPHSIEGALLASAVVLLLWSEHAAHSMDVTPHIPLILELKKTVLPLLLDQTALPSPFQSFTSYRVQLPWSTITAQLVQQSLLPSPDRDDPLIRLATLAGSDMIVERKDAVKRANTMLEHNEQRTEVRAILTYLAHADLMTGVREAAQEALDSDTRRQQTPQTPLTLAMSAAQANDMIGVRCKKCGHVTYFNKHSICKESRRVFRGDKDELELSCESCGIKMMVLVDCKGYK